MDDETPEPPTDEQLAATDAELVAEWALISGMIREFQAKQARYRADLDRSRRRLRIVKDDDDE